MPQTYYIDAWGGRQVTDTIEFPQESFETCAIHSKVKLDRDGKCPVCKMIAKIWKGRRDPDW
jgi:hypothetical protein